MNVETTTALREAITKGRRTIFAVRLQKKV
jgi:hypothetical protein